ncbi:MAG: AAA family ATPase [Actinomycetota bacterium]
MTKRDPSDRAASGDSVPSSGSKKSSGSSSKQKKKSKAGQAGSAPAPVRTPRVIAIANQKGGVGKSTTAVSLGAALADLGQRVLVLDLDPQGNASTGMGIKHDARDVTVYDVLVSEALITEAIVHTQVKGLDAIPSTIDLAGAEIELVSQFSRELRLRKALEPLTEDGYDFVFLDCPPSLGLLTVNALAAAQELIVPIQCEYYALEGLGQLLHNVRLVQQNINPTLRLTGIVMTMFDSRTKLSEQVVDEVRRYFDDRVYDVIIPRTVRLSEAPGFGQPITVYDPKSRGAEAYRALAKEVLERPLPKGEAMPVMEDMPRVILPPEESAPEPPDVASVDPEPASVATPPVTSEPGSSGGAGSSASRSKAGASAEKGTANPAPAEATDPPPGGDPAARDPGRQRSAGSSSASPSATSDAHTDSDSPSPSGQRTSRGSYDDVIQQATDEPSEKASGPQPPPTSEAPAKRPARAGASGASDSAADRVAPDRGPATSADAPRGRRVVVIDERAEEAAVMSGQEAPVRHEEADPGAGADIGEQLPQEPSRRKRWWQFGKGGEE